LKSINKNQQNQREISLSRYILKDVEMINPKKFSGMKLKNSIIAEKSIITLSSGEDVFKNKFRVAIFDDNKWCLNLIKKIRKNQNINVTMSL
jgi:hypothetical protein